jgi:hypothetical protein
MKKLLSFLLVACFATTLFAQTIVSTEPSNKNVILEEYTGTNCVYCPDGHKTANQIMTNNPGRAWAINVHQGGFSGNDPDYKTDWGNALAQQYGINSYPAATVNRGASWTSTRSTWTQWANTIIAEASPVNVAASATIDWDTRELTVLVEVYYTGNAANPTNKLNVALLQDNVLGPQTGGPQYYPQMMRFGTLYQHMHMLRHFLTGQWGVDISTTTAGSFFTQTFTYTIPEHIRNIPLLLEDLEVLVYVCEGNKTILSGCKAELTLENIPAIFASINSMDAKFVPTCDGVSSIICYIRNPNDFAINSLNLEYSIDDITRIYSWNKRAIPAQAWDSIHMPAFLLQANQNTNLTVTLSKINDINTYVSRSKSFNKEVVAGDAEMMTLVIKTDQYANETSCKIFNPDGTILFQKLNGFTNNTEHRFDFTPVMDGCHRVEVYDSYGDGISPGYVRILDHSGTIIYNNNGNFGSKLAVTVSVGYIDPPVQNTVIASNEEYGTIFPLGEIAYLEGTSATYIFTPNENYEVKEVFIDGEPMGMAQATEYTFPNIYKDYTIHVTFKAINTTVTYTITATAGENGTIDPEGETEYEEGETPTYTFTPNENYEVEEVFIDGEPVGMAQATTYTFSEIDKDYTIHVTFRLVDGIKDINGMAISVSPNPMNDKLFVKGMYDKLEIFSVSGQLITAAQNQPTVDVSNLVKGVYIVKIQSNGQTCTFKVVK